QFVGSAAEIDGGPEGVVMDYEGDPNDPFHPIVGSSLTFEFLVEDSSHETFLNEVAAAREGRFMVVLKRGSGLPVEWVGYLVSDQIQQRDEYFPYHTTLFAVDGIARLRDIEYKNPATGNPYTGRQTWLQHLYNVMEHIGTTGVVTMPNIRFRHNINLFDVAMNTAADPLTQVDCDHEVFKGKDNEGNEEIWSVYDVLFYLCNRFNATFRHVQGGFALFRTAEFENSTQKVYNYDANQVLVSTDPAASFDVTIDYSTAGAPVKRRGGVLTYLQPLKRLCVDYEHLTQNNRAFGLSWPGAGTDYVALPGAVTVDDDTSTQLKLVMNFKVKSFVTVTIGTFAYPIHRYFFKIYVRINGNSWLKRTLSGDFYNLTPETASWSSLESYVEVVSPIINPQNNGEDVLFQLNILSPYLTTTMNGGTIDLKIILDRVERTDGTAMVNGAGPFYNATLTWLLKNPVVEVLDEGLGNNPDTNIKRTCAYDSTSGNTAEHIVRVKLGDGPMPYTVSRMQVSGTDTTSWKLNGTGTGYPLDERIAREIMEIRQRPVPVFQVTALTELFGPLKRLVDGSSAYVPLRLRWSSKNDEWAGEFVRIARVFTPTSDPPIDLGFPPGGLPGSGEPPPT
ncbi:MAG: hypothetical protein D6765_03570, partial [Bacteroidetes bacterium]